MFLKHGSAPQQQDDNRDHVRDVEEDGAAGGVRTKGDRGPEVQQAEEHVEDEGEDDGADGDVEVGRYVGEAGKLVSLVGRCAGEDVERFWDKENWERGRGGH